MNYNQEFFMDNCREKDYYANNYQNGREDKGAQKGICCVNSVCFYPVNWDCDYKAKEENNKKPCHDDKERDCKEKKPCCKHRFDCREERDDSHKECDKKDWYENNCGCHEDKDYYNDKHDCYCDDNKHEEDNNKCANREEKKDCHNNNQNSCNCNRCCRNRCSWFCGRGFHW